MSAALRKSRLRICQQTRRGSFEGTAKVDLAPPQHPPQEPAKSHAIHGTAAGRTELSQEVQDRNTLHRARSLDADVHRLILRMRFFVRLGDHVYAAGPRMLLSASNLQRESPNIQAVRGMDGGGILAVLENVPPSQAISSE